MAEKLIKIHERDNVVVALENLKAGDIVTLEQDSITVLKDTEAKHKISLEDLDEGEHIIMYGVLVGKAVKRIRKGEVLTTSNISHESAKVRGKTTALPWSKPEVSHWSNRTFMGYQREDGQVGTANIWLFFPLVFCENRNIEVLREAFEKELFPKEVNKQRLYLRSLVYNNGIDVAESAPAVESLRLFDNVEVKFITHQSGCGGTRDDSTSLARLLSGYITNPNVAGATILSLGCQNLQIRFFKEALEAISPDMKKPVRFYEQQALGTVDEMLNTIIKDTFYELRKANENRRQPAPLSKLKIGLECGGSDGFSGISANPTLGYVSDQLAALGGSPILSEFPELCGVEQEIVNRCIDESKAERFLSLMAAYERSARNVGSGFDMNPSPGNIKDGLITDAIKSAGAAKKGGTSPVVDVLDYGEYVRQPGLNLLCTPGNDVESTTALAGAGANLILFTTGLGTPTGNPIAPVIKVSSNTALAERMPDIIDFDTGVVIKGEKTIPEIGDELIELIIEVASGAKSTKAMLLNQNDFIPWKRGVSL